MSRAWKVSNVDPCASLDLNARKILRVRLGEFYSYDPIVDDPTAQEQHHNLRISAKRLRYTLELFQTVFGDVGDRNVERVKSIQEELGHLHDIDVRIELIQRELIELARDQIDELGRSLAASPPAAHTALTTAALRPPPDDPRRGLLALLSRQYAERTRVYLRFKALWDRYDQEGMRQELVSLSIAQSPGSVPTEAV